ncbi:hypothetical protein EDC19_1289 [Natranaerovirga hydrolytica]|uniref:Outer membrane lipoprotein-sorting protein n=1 Tax=Natranaerovirga hydrolytica TaxID=680378 RepID=A0A4V2Q0B3_9FIRM|nr:hypothetical protein [Natranaerovirga hydrolytica]TCK93111.1 hypothetical protein EDC19_1289 [Natranaerovirga hydrolytica]
MKNKKLKTMNCSLFVLIFVFLCIQVNAQVIPNVNDQAIISEAYNQLLNQGSIHIDYQGTLNLQDELFGPLQIQGKSRIDQLSNTQKGDFSITTDIGLGALEGRYDIKENIITLTLPDLISEPLQYPFDAFETQEMLHNKIQQEFIGKEITTITNTQGKIYNTHLYQYRQSVSIQELLDTVIEDQVKPSFQEVGLYHWLDLTIQWDTFINNQKEIQKVKIKITKESEKATILDISMYFNG